MCERKIGGDVMLNNSFLYWFWCMCVCLFICKVKYGANMLNLMTSRNIPNVFYSNPFINMKSHSNQKPVDCLNIFKYVILVHPIDFCFRKILPMQQQGELTLQRKYKQISWFNLNKKVINIQMDLLTFSFASFQPFRWILYIYHALNM